MSNEQPITCYRCKAPIDTRRCSTVCVTGGQLSSVLGEIVLCTRCAVGFWHFIEPELDSGGPGDTPTVIVTPELLQLVDAHNRAVAQETNT